MGALILYSIEYKILNTKEKFPCWTGALVLYSSEYRIEASMLDGALALYSSEYKVEAPMLEGASKHHTKTKNNSAGNH